MTNENQGPLTNPTLDVVSRIDEDTFNLSEKIFTRMYGYDKNTELYCDELLVKDVKEFIRRLKDVTRYYWSDLIEYKMFLKEIDALCGEDLK